MISMLFMWMESGPASGQLFEERLIIARTWFILGLVGLFFSIFGDGLDWLDSKIKGESYI